MENDMSERIKAEAWSWHCAVQRANADWDGFTIWLETSPAHRAAYDEVALIDHALDRQSKRLDAVVEAVWQDDVPWPHRRWGLWAGGAMAAAAAALLLALPALDRDAVPSIDYHTPAGQSQEIALTDGSHVTLGPSSALTISGRQQDVMTLKGGAWFDIRHQPDRTLTISTVGQQITDIGTKFDIMAVPGHLRVAVAEGRVAIRPQNQSGNSVTLSAGHRIEIDIKRKVARIDPVAAQDVGSWRSGRLIYNDTPLSLVVADISRYVGRQVTVSPDVAERHFSGVLAVGNGADPVDELGALMGLEAQDQGNGLRLSTGGS